MTTQTTGADTNNGGDNHQPPMSAIGKEKKKHNLIAYFLLPGIIPEIKELTRGRFGYLAYLIAMIYQLVRILPQNHPYTKPENIGKFGFRHVIAAAADNITLDRKNIDQIIVFFAVMAGVILIIFQFASFLLFLFMGNAWAGPGVPAEADSLFITLNPQEDIAFFMIREVFGIPDMFGTLDGGQTGLHIALQTLFKFYNLAILFVAVLVFLYYVVVIVGETAQTGVPFGQRFSHIYAPFRLVIAIGLLVPLNYGFNGAQYIGLYAAKLGSSFATNGWIRFNSALNGANPLGVENSALIAQPNIPDISGLVEFMSTMVSCREAYDINEGIIVQAYFVDNNNNPLILKADSYITVRDQAVTDGKKGHISLYFGVIENIATKHPGNIKPYCGEVKLPIQVSDMPSVDAVGSASPQEIQRSYFALIYRMWTSENLRGLGRRISLGQLAREGKQDPCSIDIDSANGITVGECGARYTPPRAWAKGVISIFSGVIKGWILGDYNNLRNQVNYQIENEVLLTGWGGAGIWYNKIAQVNGAFVTATMNLPSVATMPIVMVNTREEKEKSDGSFVGCKGYESNLANNKSENKTGGGKDDYYSRVMNETWQYWRCDRDGKAENFFLDSVSAIFGLNGLFNLRQEVEVVGVDGRTIRTTIHPLAKLATIGKSLVESAIQNMGLAMASSFGGGALGVLGPHLGPALDSASAMFVSISTIGLSIGFILYYILPFLPFMYFFFAVGGWVKGLFEAMVGAPLWAMAHLRIDGDGIPGKSAMNGYILIFEIFIRPILTVFGLIGGLAIFAAMATILNEVFDLVANNITDSKITPGAIGGGELEFGRHMIDAFFFTIMYAMILYMMALASFKMITLVPNNILRWLGQSVSTFNDQAGDDPAAGLTQYAAMGGARIGGQLSGAAANLSKGTGSAFGEAFGLSSAAGKGSKP